MKNVFLIVSLACLGLFGCNGNSGTSSSLGEQEQKQRTAEVHHEHAAHGPHGGELVELGSGKFHAEVVHTNGIVEVYILDGAMRNPTEKVADQVAINIVLDETVRQFTVAVNQNSLTSETNERRYTSKDAALLASLEDESAVAKLRVAIDGRSYSGELIHDHDHGGHSHADHVHEQAERSVTLPLR